MYPYIPFVIHNNTSFTIHLVTFLLWYPKTFSSPRSLPDFSPSSLFSLILRFLSFSLLLPWLTMPNSRISTGWSLCYCIFRKSQLLRLCLMNLMFLCLFLFAIVVPIVPAILILYKKSRTKGTTSKWHDS